MTSWADPHLPGLEPHVGQLETRYAKWLGACGKCRAPVLTVTNPNRTSTYTVDIRPTEGGNLTLTPTTRALVAAVPPRRDNRSTDLLYKRHNCTRKAT